MQSTQIADSVFVLLQTYLPAIHCTQVSTTPALMAFQPFITTILMDLVVIGVAKINVLWVPAATFVVAAGSYDLPNGLNVPTVA